MRNTIGILLGAGFSEHQAQSLVVEALHKQDSCMK